MSQDVYFSAFERLINEVIEEDNLKPKDAYLIPKNGHLEVWLNPDGFITVSYFDYSHDQVNIPFQELVKFWCKQAPCGLNLGQQEEELEYFLNLETMFLEALSIVRPAIEEQRALMAETQLEPVEE